MANRSDFNSVFPRRYKRMLALQQIKEPFKNADEYGATKRLWIEAHKHAKWARNQRLVSRSNVDRSTEPDESN